MGALEWFVVMTKPGKQDDVAKKLSTAGFEVFDPKLKQYSRKRSIYVKRALFPLYVFVRMDIELKHQLIKYTRGVLRVLGIGAAPHPISDEVVSKLKASCDEKCVINAKYVEEDIRTGDKVRITDGPFEGLEAVVSGLYGDKQRVEVLLDLFKVSISERSVKKV